MSIIYLNFFYCFLVYKIKIFDIIRLKDVGRFGGNMRKFTFLTLSIIFLVFLYSCNFEDKELIIKETPVKTIVLKEEKREKIIKYRGTVAPENFYKKSFGTDGAIRSISVKKGDAVKIGQILASLDTENIESVIDTENPQLSEKYKTYLDIKHELDSQKKVFFEKIASYSLDKTSNENVENHKNIVEKSESSLEEARKDYLKDIFQILLSKNIALEKNIVNDIDGYVVDVLQNKGEIVGAGYPSVIIRDKNLVVNIGLSSDDKNKVKVLDSAFISHGKKRIKAIIKSVNSVPDEFTGTYEIKVSFVDEGIFNIGEQVEVGILSGNSKGIWLNINYILNDGTDYVYVVKEGRAFRKNIEIISISNDMALVSGLKENDELIISGYSSVSDGYKVKVRNEEAQKNKKNDLEGKDDE